MSHEIGHNKFSDWTDAEFKKILGLKEREDRPRREAKINNVGYNPYPSAWDWR